MMDVTFMWGSMTLTFLYLCVGLIVAWMLWAPVRKLIYFLPMSRVDYLRLGIVAVFAFMFVFNHNAPRRTIDLPINRDQIEYDQPKDVEIITPAPRTQDLPGFTPLGG